MTSHNIASPPEEFEITEKALSTINEARAQGGRVIAVGTTTARALESAVNAARTLEPARTKRGADHCSGIQVSDC